MDGEQQLPLPDDSRDARAEAIGRHSSKKKQAIVLAALMANPVSCQEMEQTVVHRGQAVVEVLRKAGHDIRTVDGWYVYHGKTARSHKISRKLQTRYYNTIHWRNMARRRRAIDNHQCVQCKTGPTETEPLHVHHWTYRLFAESLGDLTTLCPACHRNIHSLISVHFPRYETEAIVKRLANDPLVDGPLYE